MFILQLKTWNIFSIFSVPGVDEAFQLKTFIEIYADVTKIKI